MSNTYAPETCHNALLAKATRRLRFDPAGDFAAWRQELDETFRTLVGDMPDPVPLDITVEATSDHDEFREIRFSFTAEPFARVPCHLIVPRVGQSPYPVVICLQGHSTGMHISLGRAKYDGDAEVIAGGRDIAIQAVREGYAALVVEQRCFGERADARPEEVRHLHTTCTHASMTSLLLGRTMIGERVTDISRAIDALGAFPEISTTRIACTGNSGGGTTTYYAACLDSRIAVAMPSCVVCTYASSLGQIDACQDNYLPGALKYFDMGDLAGLIAPRPLIVVAGREDFLFPFEGVLEAYVTIEQIYAAANASAQCRLVVGEGGHQFYPEIAWPVFREISHWTNNDIKGE